MTEPMPPLDEAIGDRLVDGLFQEVDRLRIKEPELAERLTWQHANVASVRYARAAQPLIASRTQANGTTARGLVEAV